MSKNTFEHVYLLLADVLDYPTPLLPDRVNRCVTLLSQIDPQAAAAMDRFRLFVEQTPSSRLEELYTATFDLQVVCSPYAGYHLFGESYKRGDFLAALSARYSAAGFSAGKELPDHVSVVLRYLAAVRDEGETTVLVSECLIPTVERMLENLKNGNPYRAVFQALLKVLKTPQPVSIGRDM